MPRTLNDHMELGHVVQVHPDGTVTDGPEGVYAPELHAISDDDGSHTSETDPELFRQAGYAGWQLQSGHSGQYGYSGPCMHPSESIGGGLEHYIMERPGFWVAVVIGEDDPDASNMWALCHIPVDADGAY